MVANVCCCRICGLDIFPPAACPEVELHVIAQCVTECLSRLGCQRKANARVGRHEADLSTTWRHAGRWNERQSRPSGRRRAVQSRWAGQRSRGRQGSAARHSPGQRPRWEARGGSVYDLATRDRAATGAQSRPAGRHNERQSRPAGPCRAVQSRRTRQQGRCRAVQSRPTRRHIEVSRRGDEVEGQARPAGLRSEA
jgi:hypothetical protein